MTRPALLLDRDGVIHVDHAYVHTPEKTDFIEGIFELVAAANRAGFDVVVITNQAGIARGFYSESEFDAYMAWMKDRFAERGATIDAVYYCPHHPTHGIGHYRATCDCRKPEPGLILRAAEDRGLDLARSIFVGDKSSDMQAALRAGVGTRFLLGAETTPPDAPGAKTVDSLAHVMLILGWSAGSRASHPASGR